MIQVSGVLEIIELSQSLDHLFMLKLADKDNYEMEQVGSVLNLALGERVQSARSWANGVMSSLSGNWIHYSLLT